jgi:hypothetical protein
MSRDCAFRTSLIAVADSQSELSALRTGLVESQAIVKGARACIAASFALKAQADHLLEQANRLFAQK